MPKTTQGLDTDDGIFVAELSDDIALSFVREDPDSVYLTLRVSGCGGLPVSEVARRIGARLIAYEGAANLHIQIGKDCIEASRARYN